MDKELIRLAKSLQRDKNYIRAVQQEISQKFSQIKEEIMNEFENHPVTVELKGGINAQNISGTLSGKANLYSFIGFDAGHDPIKPIKDLLEKSNYRITFNPDSLSAIVNFEIPTAQQIFLITPMPWAEGRSWARGIETGISGIGYYLKVEKNSRSGFGIQAKEKVRENIRFKSVPYISALINKFNQKLKSIS